MNFFLLTVMLIFSCEISFGMIKLSELEEALVMACKSGQTQAVQVLLEAEVNKNILTAEGSTPLCIAAQNGHREVVRVLLRKWGRHK